ncbi:hypothetical protein GCM10027447_32460 [Glycomyces halotolerans]
MPSPTVAQQLLAGGRDLIGREGAADLSVRRLVEAAGRSTMCVYTHFGNRRRLLAEIYRSCRDDLLAGLRAARTAPELEGRYRDYAAANPRHFQYLFTADLDHLGLDPALRLGLIEAVADLVADRAGLSDRGEAIEVWLRVHGRAWLETVQRLAGEPARFDTASSDPGS